MFGRSDGMADVTDSKSVGSDTVWVQVPPSAPNIDRSIDTMLRSILLLIVSRKPAIQGICSIGVCKILCIAGFFCVAELLRHSRLKGQFEYPLRKNKIVIQKITGFKEK